MCLDHLGQIQQRVKEYKDLLSRGLVQPTNMEIYVCNVDGSDLQQVTNLEMQTGLRSFILVIKRLFFAQIMRV